jgi:hypothetical protein
LCAEILDARAARIGQLQNIEHDAEVVAGGTLLHDITLNDRFTGPRRFEVEGADLARTFATDVGFDKRRAQLIWDSVALNSTPSIGLYKEAEVALCTTGGSGGYRGLHCIIAKIGICAEPAAKATIHPGVGRAVDGRRSAFCLQPVIKRRSLTSSEPKKINRLPRRSASGPHADLQLWERRPSRAVGVRLTISPTTSVYCSGPPPASEARPIKVEKVLNQGAIGTGPDIDRPCDLP